MTDAMPVSQLDVPHIRVVQVSDFATLVDLKHLVREYVRSWYSPGMPFSEQDHLLLCSLPGEHVPPFGASFVAYYDGHPAGCALLAPPAFTHGPQELRKMYVREGLRRHGVASAMIMSAISVAQRLGSSEIIGIVQEERTGAMRLYEHAGAAPGDVSDGYRAFTMNV